MKVDLKRVFRFVRKMVAAGAIAASALAAVLAGGAGTSRAALVISNGSFESPNLGGGYGSYTVGLGWRPHNLCPTSYTNGNLNQMSESYVSTGGMSTGSQYAMACRQGDPANAFSGTVGSAPSGLYVDQTIGNLTAADLTASYSLSADLIHAFGTFPGWGSLQAFAGAGATIGFVNGNTGNILAETNISYASSYGPNDTTPVKITGSLNWAPSASGLAIGTPINVFVGFRLDTSASSPDLNAVAVDNLVLTDTFPNLTWTGSGSPPTQWSTNAGVLNWSSSGGQKYYTDEAHVIFGDSVGAGSTTVSISNGDVNPGSVMFNNTAKSYTLTGSNAIAGYASLTVTGSGLVTVLNNNTYTGDTTISSGTLQLGNGGASGSIASPIILNNGALVYSRSDNVTVSNAIGGSGSVINLGSGTLTISSAIEGNSVINQGSGTLTISGAIGGGGSVIQQGAGRLNLTNYNSYTGGTFVNGGTLALAVGGQSGTLRGSLTINPGGTAFCAVNNALGYGGSNWVQNITINGGVLSTGVATDNGWGTNITMTAGTMSTTVAGGYFAMGTPSAASPPTFNILGSTSPSLISANLADRNDSGNPGITFNVTRGSAVYDLMVTGNILTTGAGGTGITLNGTGITLLTGSNTYTSTTTVSGGTLQLGDGTSGHDGTINATSGVTNNATLVYNLYGNQSINYAISGGGNLTKLGQNELTLTGYNSYSGTTSLGGGILNIDGGDGSTGMVVNGGALYVNTASPATSVSVAGGATLGGTGSLTSGTANVANGGIFDFSQNAGSTFMLGGVNYAGSGTVNLGLLTPSTSAVPFLQSLGAFTAAGQINLNANVGAVSVLAGTYDLVSYGSIAGTGTSAFHLSVNGLSNRQNAKLVDVSNQLEAVIGGQTPYWSGNHPDWLSTNAWTLQPSGNPTTFQTGDANIFDDSAGTGAYGGAVGLNSGNVAPGSVTFNNLNLAYTVSGNFGISGSGALGVQGGGSVTLLTSNSYTGATAVSNGTLQLGNGGAAGSLSPSSAIALGGNAVLAFSRSNAVVQGVDFGGSPISGAGSLVQNGPGALIFTANNTFTGTTTINGGTLQLGAGGMSGSLSPSSAISLSNATLDFNRGDSVTIPNTINGSNFTLVQNGGGTTTFTTQQTQSGGLSSGTVDINAGQVVLNFAPASSANGGPFGGSNVWNIASGGTLVCAQQRVTRYQDTYNVNGTVLFGDTYANFRCYLLNLNLSGGSLLGTSFGSGYNAGTAGGAGVGTWNVAGGATSTIAADLFLVNGGYNELDVNVASGAAATPLLWSGSIIDVDPYNSTWDGMTLRKLGSGLMVMTGTANAYKAAAFIIDAGTVQIGSGGTAGTMLPCPVTDNASFIFNRAGTLTVASAISGTGSVTQNGSGATVLTASNTYTGATAVNAGALYVNGSLASAVTVNGGVLGGSGSAPSVSVAVGGGIEGGYNGTGTLTLGRVAYAGSGSFTTNGFTNYPAAGSLAPLNVTASNALNTGAGPVAVNLGGLPALSTATYHLIQHSGVIGGGGSAAFTLGTAPNNVRHQFNYRLLNDPGYLDVAVSVVAPVIWTGSLSTAWNATDTLPAPMNWSYAGSATNFLGGDFVQFDNSTASGGTVNISNGNVLPLAVLFNNDVGHSYTLTGTNGIAGSGQLVKNGPGSLTIATSDSYSGGTNLYGGVLNANAASALGTGPLTVNGGTLNANVAQPLASAIINSGLLVINDNNAIGSGALTLNGGSLDSTVAGGVTLPNNAQSWNGNFTFNGTQNLSMGTGAVSLGSSRIVTVNADTLTVDGLISDGGNGYSLTKAGSGTLTLGAENTYTGGTTVTGGTLLLTAGNDGNGTIRGTLTIDQGGTVICGQHDVFGYNSAAVSLTTLNINGGLLDKAANTNVNETLTGVTVNMTGGTWAGTGGRFDMFYNGYGDPNDSVNVLASSRTAFITAELNFRSLSPLFTVASGTTPSGIDLLVSGQLIGTYGLTKDGPGVMALANSSTYAGGTTINAGTLQLGTGAAGMDGSIASTSGVTDNAALVYNLAGTQTASYPISGNGNVTMTGSGMLVLAGNNSYSGETLVSGGTLQLQPGNANALGTGALAANRGTLDLEGNSVTVTSFSGAAGVVTDYGTGGGTTTLTVSQSNTTTFRGTIADGPSNLLSLALTGPGKLILTGTNTFSGGTTVTDGTLILASPTALAGGSSLTVGQGATSLFAPAIAGPSLAASPAGAVAVPEPGTWALVLAALWSAIACYRVSKRTETK
jgi:fibronectin-binding autotransporter adhesin